jgi:hypothetical protein
MSIDDKPFKASVDTIDTTGRVKAPGSVADSTSDPLTTYGSPGGPSVPAAANDKAATAPSDLSLLAETLTKGSDQ